MSNTLKIARKEFTDLIGNRLIIFIIFVYLFLIAKTIYDFHTVTPENIKNGNLAMSLLMGLWYILTVYGTLVGIVLGFSSISSERKGNALNTLIVKPVYRDTIINGKLIGIFGFIICLFGIATFIYFSVLLIFYGNYIGAIILNILVRLLFILFLSIIYVMIFFIPINASIYNN